MCDTCECSAGAPRMTPLPTANPPGQERLHYRIGTHASFVETMLAALSTRPSVPPATPRDNSRALATGEKTPLQALTRRQPDDPAIALLDGWATVADVLTFYNERIANEGYLRTSTERRSLLELGRLVGYSLRPGVAASTYLAYTLVDNMTDDVGIPAGARVQSVPGPGELPQTFETADALKARARWNNLKPRLTLPQTEYSIKNAIIWLDADTGDGPTPYYIRTVDNLTEGPPTLQLSKELCADCSFYPINARVYLKGINTNLKPGDMLLIAFRAGATPEAYRVMAVQPDAAADRTLARLRPWQDVNIDLKNKIVIQFNVPEDAPKLQQDDQVWVAFGSDTPPLPYQVEKVEASNRFQLVKGQNESSAQDSSHGRTMPMWVAAPSLVWTSAAHPLHQNQAAASTLPITTLGAAPHTVISPPQWSRSLTTTLTVVADPTIRMWGIMAPNTADKVALAVANANATTQNEIKVYALRVKASLFGHNAPKKQKLIRRAPTDIEKRKHPEAQEITETLDADSWSIQKDIEFGIDYKTVHLDAVYDKIIPGSWVILDATAAPPKVVNQKQELVITTVDTVRAGLARADYGVSGKTSLLRLAEPWILANDSDCAEALDLTTKEKKFEIIRSTLVYAQSEELPLAEEPLDTPLCGGDEFIELDGVYEDLLSERPLIISGELVTSAGATGITDSELVTVAAATHEVRMLDAKTPLPGDSLHTRLKLMKPLVNCYKRDTVTIYGNVVKATHGETRNEVVGSGDGSRPLQAFTLKQPPLTHVAAATTSGIESTLQVRVNDLLWDEVDTLAALEPTDRNFITRTDNEGKTTVIFGDGNHGARPPTGLENIKALYRSGIGKAGNVKAGQLTLLMTRPNGVKDVTNPLPVSGGADKDTLDQARPNIPLALLALDRLVSVSDYAAFARTFAGIGKASALRLSDGLRQVVHVTIAGIDGGLIEVTSELYRALQNALHTFGDPFQPLVLATRELLLIVVSARVRLLPAYQWEPVERQMRNALLSAFGFQQRELGQDVILSEVVSVLQHVPGVAYVDLEALDVLDQTTIEQNLPNNETPPTDSNNLATRLGLAPKPRLPIQLARPNPDSTPAGPRILPAQLAYLTPDIPSTLMLSKIEG